MFKDTRAINDTYCLIYQYLQIKDETEVPPQTVFSRVHILEVVQVYQS